MALIKVGVPIIGSGIKRILIWLRAPSASPTCRVLLVEEVRPSVISIEAQTGIEASFKLCLKRIVVGNCIVSASVQVLELWVWTVSLTSSCRQSAQRYLVDIDWKWQVGSMTSDVR